MGAGGMYPNNPYSNDYTGYNHPYYNQGGYSSPNHIPPYSYPPNYGRGYQRPYYPPMNGFPQGVFSNQIGGQGFFRSPRTGVGALQSAPPSATPNGNIQLNRLGEHRPHFDEQ